MYLSAGRDVSPERLRASMEAERRWKALGVPARVRHLLIYSLEAYSLEELRRWSWDGERGLGWEVRTLPGCGPKAAAAIRELWEGPRVVLAEPAPTK